MNMIGREAVKAQYMARHPEIFYKRSPVLQVKRQPVGLIDNQAELRQLDRKLHAPVGQGKDDHGDFLVIPLSMVRGGATKPFKVHTSPIKHIILDQNVPPRGWYKPKYAKKRVRNRPCYTETILTVPYGGFCRVNCSYCVSGDTEISTPIGDIRIDNLRVDDLVYGMGAVGRIASGVLGTSKRMSYCYYMLRTQDGHTLNVTGEHPVGTIFGWVDVANLKIGDGIRMRKGWSGLTRIERVDKPLMVYNIQTITENFYANGLLVHNCYINNGTRGYRSTGIPTVDPEYPDKTRKRLKKMMVTGAAYISSFTEPFQTRMEDQYHVTERLTKVFVDEGIPVFYLSKLIPPEWALDALLENPYSYMQWSVNTSNQDHWHRMGPGTADLEEIYREIELCAMMGIYVSIQVNPIVAGITTIDEIVALIHNLYQAGANHVIFKFVETVTMARKTNMKRFRSRGFRSLVDKLEHNWSQVIGGVLSIAQAIRVEWLKVFLEETRKLGITMSTCYEYYADGDAGTNLAPYFTTADQCHGRGVPVYFRPEPGAPFKPLPGCYRKGCLYCEDFGTQACGSCKMLAAAALKYSDLCKVQLIGDDRNWELCNSCVDPDDAYLYVDNPPIGNPGLQTDAEMWGWDLEEDIDNKYRFPLRDKDGNPLEEMT